jgi:hypothetical protein
MPIINVEYSDDDNMKLQEEYIKMCIVWPQLGHKDLPPPFELWVGARAVAGDGTSISLEVDEMHLFNAIEKLLGSLDAHDFGLTHLSREDDAVEESTLHLANELVTDLKLQPKYIQRIQALFEKHLQTPKEIADAAQIGLTNRARGALYAAYKKLIERTTTAVDHLGEERAVGRVEGAGAILASLNIIERSTAEERTDAFRQQVRAARKPNWVGKVFGRSLAQDSAKKE